jgi:type I restriction enzyme R subunit
MTPSILILHVAYGKKPMTRSERVKKAQGNDYFAKYQGKAREIIDLLLAKYADQGITAIDDIGDLQVSPLPPRVPLRAAGCAGQCRRPRPCGA